MNSNACSEHSYPDCGCYGPPALSAVSRHVQAYVIARFDAETSAYTVSDPFTDKQSALYHLEFVREAYPDDLCKLYGLYEMDEDE